MIISFYYKNNKGFNVKRGLKEQETDSTEESSEFIVGDKAEWRSKIDAPPSFLRADQSPPLPREAMTSPEDLGKPIKESVSKGYTQSKRYTFTMTKKAIVLLAISQLLLGGLFFFSGFGTSTYIHYKNAQRAKKKALARKKQSAKDNKKIKTKKVAAKLPFGVASIVTNEPDIYAVNVAEFRVMENAIKRARELWASDRETYVANYVDYEGIPWYAVRFGHYETADLADKYRENFEAETELSARTIQSEAGEKKLVLSKTATAKREAASK